MKSQHPIDDWDRLADQIRNLTNDIYDAKLDPSKGQADKIIDLLHDALSTMHYYTYHRDLK